MGAIAEGILAYAQPLVNQSATNANTIFWVYGVSAPFSS